MTRIGIRQAALATVQWLCFVSLCVVAATGIPLSFKGTWHGGAMYMKTPPAMPPKRTCYILGVEPIATNGFYVRAYIVRILFCRTQPGLSVKGQKEYKKKGSHGPDHSIPL